MSKKFLYILVALVLISGIATAVIIPQMNIPSPSSGTTVSSGVKESSPLSHPVTRSPVVQNAFVSSPVLTGNGISSDKKALSTGENVIGNGKLGTDSTSSLPESYEFVMKWGSSGTGDGQFNHTFGVAVDSLGNVYVADSDNNRIQKFTNTGIYITQWGSEGSGDGQFNWPVGVAIDNAGNVFVADFINNRIQKFSNTGTYITQWGSSGTGDGQFNGPLGVAVDSAGNVFVADSNNNRIQKFTNTGIYNTQWGSEGSGDGQFKRPWGVAINSAGNVYVADYDDHRIQKFSNTGTYITQWGSSGTGDGQFKRPIGVAVDSAGNVYVGDSDNDRIQKFSNKGTYITQWGSDGSGDVQFYFTSNLAIDSAGNVYVGDIGNNRIQKFRNSISLISISPSSGLNTKSLSATIHGGTFLGDVTINLTRSGYENITADSVSVISPSYIICTLPLTGTAAGDWNVVVTNQNEAKGAITNGFTIIGTAPVVYFISPDSGINNGDCAITLFGLNFNTGATVNLNRTGSADISATGTTVHSSGGITCTFPLSGKTAGNWNVIVTNTDGQSGRLTNGYTINNPKPTISSLSPNNEVVNTHTANYPVTVTGTNFVSGCTATLKGQNRAVTYTSSTKVTVTFLKGDDDIAGSNPVIITNPSPSEGASASFNYLVGNPAPTITGIKPATGVNTGTVSVTITGMNFKAGATVKLTKAGKTAITGTGVSVKSPGKLTCKIPVKGKTSGKWNVVVTNKDGQKATKTNGFTITGPVPVITTVSPKNGSTTKNTQVTISGKNFRSGASVKMIMGTTARTGTIKSLDSTKIVCVLPTKNAKKGTWGLKVTNSDTSTVTKTNLLVLK